MIRNRVVQNASWLIGCQIAQSILGLVISMFTARYLGPANFGTINYASSVVAFVTPIMNLGLGYVMIQEMVNSPESEGEILGTSLVLTFLSALCCIVGVIAFASIANVGETETIIVCALYSLILIAQAIEMIKYWYQAKLLSKYYSVTALIAYTVVSLYKIFLLASHKNIYWFAISNAIDYFIIGISLLIIYKKIGSYRLSFSKEWAHTLFNKGKYFIISNMMITIFAQTDRIMLKMMIDSTATGYYSAGAACAGMTSFVFTAIIDSLRPTILSKKKISSTEYEYNLILLYSIIIYLALAQSAVMTLLARPIILILYGEAYVDSISVLKLIVWYTTFSYLGSVRNIWILAEDKQQYLWIINLSGALTNVILNALLIPLWGIMGAAFASLVTQIFTNVIIGFILKPIKHSNYLMIKSLKPEYLIKAVKKIRR